jgi:CTP synthase (UTP-ammonia lyase)
MTRTLRVAVIGDFDKTITPHLATNEAIPHSATRLGVEATVEWLPTQPLEVDLDRVEAADALWCAPRSRGWWPQGQ